MKRCGFFLISTWMRHCSRAKSPIFRSGQQQRVAAARALLGQPEIVVADEPTSALDADRQHAFLQLLMQECAAASATLLFVSHDRRLASQFTREVDLQVINRAHPERQAA